MTLNQQTLDCADFDVTLEGESTPAFRVLLPEFIRGNGVSYGDLTHIIPGVWTATPRGVRGAYRVGDELGVEVSIDCGRREVNIDLTVTNRSPRTLTDLWVDVCTAANNLPGKPDWSNETFLPGQPLDRAIQGRYWYEVVAPRRLFAITPSGRTAMHPHPNDPDPGAVALYSFVPSAAADARACVVTSADGVSHLYQAWNTPCRWCTPCPGNACMHLHPLLAETLAPGASARLRGIVGIHRGDGASLARAVERFRADPGAPYRSP